MIGVNRLEVFILMGILNFYYKYPFEKNNMQVRRMNYSARPTF